MNSLEIFDRPIAYHRIFATKLGVCGAVFLSQAIYWALRTNNPDGWFYKSRDEWTEETGLTRDEQETARKKAKSLGILEEKLAGQPAIMHYRINFEILEAIFSWGISTQLERGKTPNKHGGNNPTIYTENTTENTTIMENPIVKTKEEANEALGNSPGLDEYKANKANRRQSFYRGSPNKGLRQNITGYSRPKKGTSIYGIDP